jgi:hypothetical protein
MEIKPKVKYPVQTEDAIVHPGEFGRARAGPGTVSLNYIEAFDA